MARTRSIRTGFEQRLLAQLRKCQFVAGQHIVVGFSGGPDSLALAAALRRAAPQLDVHFLLVHVNHRLQADSDRDAAICHELAGRLEFPLRVMALEDGLAERTTGIGIEEQARRERYLALKTAAIEWNSNVILLGHQANDQAETVLLHLFRGAGLQGLSGMQVEEVRPIPWWGSPSAGAPNFQIVRPLLDESREKIAAYLAASLLQPVIDNSNLEVEFDRNWVRLRVMPAILERWPSGIETIARSAQASRVDLNYLESQVEAHAQEIVSFDRTLRTDKLLAIDAAVAFRVVRRWLQELGVEDVTLDVVARIYGLAATGNERAAIEAGSHHTIVCDRGILTTLESLLVSGYASMPMVLGDSERSWSIELRDDFPDSWIALSIPHQVDVQVRALQAGDRWYGSRRRIFDDLRAAKIHPQLRNRLLAVVADEGVLLIPAIYPTIRSETIGMSCRQVSVRWRKVDEWREDNAKTKASNAF